MVKMPTLVGAVTVGSCVCVGPGDRDYNARKTAALFLKSNKKES